MVKYLGLWITLALASVQGEAAVMPDFAQQLEEGITWFGDSIWDRDTGQEATGDAWYYRRFWLRLKPKATFEIPGLKLTIAPEVELLWERDYPDGWTTYKP